MEIVTALKWTTTGKQRHYPEHLRDKNLKLSEIKDIWSLPVESRDSGWESHLSVGNPIYLKRFAAHHQGSQLKPVTARETHPGQQWFPLSAKWTCVRFPGMAPQRKQHMFTKPNHITQMGRTRRSSKAEHNHHRNFLTFLWNPKQKKQM